MIKLILNNAFRAGIYLTLLLLNAEALDYKVVHISGDDTLSIRIAPGTGYKKIGDFSYNETGINVMECVNILNGEKWCQVRFLNYGVEKIGWVSAKYLEPSTKKSLQPFIPDHFVTSATNDLNSDGISDTVSVKTIKNPKTGSNDTFILTINDRSISGALSFIDGFVIVDIDKNDAFKEVAVHTPGESDDDEYIIYRYEGKSIRKLGGIARWPRFYGNGIVLVDNWIDFWSQREKYLLDHKTATLKVVPQSLYHVGLTVKVAKPFPIYRTTAYKQNVAYLGVGSEIEILVCDPSAATTTNEGFDNIMEYSYLIKSSTGLVGWVKGGTLESEHTRGLPIAD